MSFPRTSLASRLPFIDWVRGAAAIIMLQGHAFHSLTRPEDRASGPYVLSQFVGGIAPAIFLFLTGVTLAFLVASREKQGEPAWRRVTAAWRRSAYLFGLAFAFRLQLWIFGFPQSPWTDLFKVDILNCMGLSVLALGPLAALGARSRLRLAALAGAGIAAASPLVSNLGAAWLHPFLRNYLVPDYNYFAFFPWAAFLAFGLSAGTILRSIERDSVNRLMQWTALVGFGLVLAGQYTANLPYSLYPKADFWLDSPALVTVKLGLILLALAAAYLWTEFGSAPGWSWVRQFGVTSLLVYWVHIELVYGRWFGHWKDSLTVGQSAAFALALIPAMLGLSLLQTHRGRIKAWLVDLAGQGQMEPRRASGD